MSNLILGLDTFGDVPRDDSGELVSQAEATRRVVEEAVLADQLGVDVFTIGEHHHPEFVISSPEMVLATIAGRTNRIRLGSGVTVLSSDDPVRVFQRFSTLDALSNGRAEPMLGRGSFTESFPLFGFDLVDYEVLFEEKLELFHRILDEQPVTWSGTTRAPLQDAEIFPHTDSGRLTTWIGAGGTPASIVRAATYGFPLMLAVIGGDPARYRGHVELYRRATVELGKTPQLVGMHSPGFVADTDEEAQEIYFPRYKEMYDRIGWMRGRPPVRRSEFDREVETGSLYVGSPDTVARKIAATVTAVGLDRFDLLYTVSSLSTTARMHGVELFGAEVAPRVRTLLSAH
jgi:probable LLM family oxidoreductase